MCMIENILDFFDTYSDALTAISAVVVSFVAIYGLQEWKKQMKGKTNYEIARRYLKQTLKLRNEVLNVRNPGIFLGEIETALKESGLDGDEYKDKIKINRIVYQRRWKNVQQARSNLELEIIDAEVSWGKQAEEVSRPLFALVGKLFAAIQLYLDGFSTPIRENIIYNQGSPESPDDFSIEVDKAIDKIKEFLNPHLL